jgi:hypothetical protein
VVRCQGWEGFVPKTKAEAGVLDRRKQWMFFKASTQLVLTNLKSINFDELAQKNTSVKGFGKADVVGEYVRLFGLPLPDPSSNLVYQLR